MNDNAETVKNADYLSEIEDLREELEAAEERADDAERYMRKMIANIEENIRQGFSTRFDLIAVRLADNLAHMRLIDSTPGARERRDANERPDPGDLVLETTQFNPRGDALGVLVSYTKETGKAIVRNLATGVDESWGNAQFIRILPAKEIADIIDIERPTNQGEDR